MALGDGENDVEMLRMCGLGVAMGNAGPGARAAADVVVGGGAAAAPLHAAPARGLRLRAAAKGARGGRPGAERGCVAPPQVATNDEHGVAQAIRQYVLGEGAAEAGAGAAGSAAGAGAGH
jgi:hypothetical protein